MNFDDMSSTSIFWIAIVAIVFFSSLFGWLERTSRYRAIERMAEKGQTIPPELLGRGPLPYDRRSWHYGHPVSSGIFLMCIGVALAVFFWAFQGGGHIVVNGHMANWLPVIGIFPFMTGLARVLAGIFERRPPNGNS